MKCYWCFSFVATLLLGLSVSLAQAQDDPVPQQSPDQESLSDDMDELDIDGMADESEESEAAAEECEEEEGPVHLFHETCHGIQIAGWINGGVYQNGFGNTDEDGNMPVQFPIHADAPMLNQAWIYAEKTLDLENCCCDWGFRVDYVFGADGPDTQAFGDEGWDNEWDTGDYYGSALPQLYAEYGCCDWSVKAGKFYTLIGYEVVQAPLNFFYSHAYCMYYAEPFSHTGALATKQVHDNLSVTGGYVMGWDSGFNNSNDAHMFLGSASWTSCDECLNVIYATTLGKWGEGTFIDDSNLPGNDGNLYMHSIVAIYDVNECVQYVFQSDYAVNSDLPDDEDTTWYGVNQYLFYTLSTCHKLGARFEWFDDHDGVRVATTGDDADYYAVTLGLNYTPNSNVMVRPEVRWDWTDGADAFDPDDSTPNEDSAFFYGVDFIVLY